MRWCGHRPAPLHSLHVLFRRWCGQDAGALALPAHNLLALVRAEAGASAFLAPVLPALVLAELSLLSGCFTFLLAAHAALSLGRACQPPSFETFGIEDF
jgi:hypothetical protein